MEQGNIISCEMLINASWQSAGSVQHSLSGPGFQFECSLYNAVSFNLSGGWTRQKDSKGNFQSGRQGRSVKKGEHLAVSPKARATRNILWL